jgi:hypothetical protein
LKSNKGRRNEKCFDEFYLHDKPVEHVSSYTHVGIERNSVEKTIVSERIKLARYTCYALMGAGMREYNGVNYSSKHFSFLLLLKVIILLYSLFA